MNAEINVGMIEGMTIEEMTVVRDTEMIAEKIAMIEIEAEIGIGIEIKIEKGIEKVGIDMVMTAKMIVRLIANRSQLVVLVVTDSDGYNVWSGMV